MCTTATAKRRRKQARLVKGKKIKKVDLMLLRWALKKKK